MKKKTFTSLEKAIDILDLFDIDNREFSAQEISEQLNLPLSSVYKYIDFLLHRQLLQHRPNSKLYGLGFMITRLNYVVEKDFNLVNIISPFLNALCEKTGETAMLTIPVGNEAVCLDCVEPRRLVKLSLDPGRRLPLHAGSSSRILLAYQSELFIDAYIHEQQLDTLTENTVTDPEGLHKMLQTIREQGYALSNSEVDTGARAISVPLLDQKERAIAGISIAGPSDRIDEEQAARFLEVLTETAEEISKALGLQSKKTHSTITA